MKFDYKCEILKNIVDIAGIFYFAFGLLTNYYWSCWKLDTDHYQPLIVWESVASIICVANFANISIIIVLLFISRKIPFKYKKSTTNQLFYFLSVPLFFGVFIYKILELFDFSKMSNHENWIFSLLMIIFEFLLCGGVMILIINVDFSMNPQIPFYQKLVRNFVLYISTIGMLNYFLYHFVVLHLKTFLEIAGNSSEFVKFYSNSSRKIKNEFTHGIEAFVILFYFVCISYLIFLQSKIKINPFNSEKSTYSDHHLFVSENRLNPNHSFSFRIPPISILFGVICLTFTLLVIIVVAAMDPLNPVKCGIYALFPVGIYLFSIVLLILQINEMQNWKKLENRIFSLDRIFIRIGVLGQILVAFSELKYNIYRRDLQSYFVILEFICLITQIIIQTITLGLALDRKWIPIYNFKSLWSSICPPVGLLSMNIAFLLFSLIVADNKFCKFNNYTMSLELMRLEILSFGETLAVLHRLHSSLIFGRIVYFTYRQ